MARKARSPALTKNRERLNECLSLGKHQQRLFLQQLHPDLPCQLSEKTLDPVSADSVSKPPSHDNSNSPINPTGSTDEHIK
jgi:hypothetical protein